METVENNQVEVNEIDEKLELLKEEARDLGITFRDNIGYATLVGKIEAKETEVVEKQQAKKKAKEAVASEDKIKIIVESRDDDNIPDQFFGLCGGGRKENILIQFGEEVEVSPFMYEHIKSKGGYIKKFKMTTDEEGMPKKEWYNKWQSRFIVSKVD